MIIYSSDGEIHSIREVGKSWYRALWSVPSPIILDSHCHPFLRGVNLSLERTWNSVVRRDGGLCLAVQAFSSCFSFPLCVLGITFSESVQEFWVLEALIVTGSRCVSASHSWGADMGLLKTNFLWTGCSISEPRQHRVSEHGHGVQAVWSRQAASGRGWGWRGGPG